MNTYNHKKTSNIIFIDVFFVFGFILSHTIMKQLIRYTGYVGHSLVSSIALEFLMKYWIRSDVYIWNLASLSAVFNVIFGLGVVMVSLSIYQTMRDEYSQGKYHHPIMIGFFVILFFGPIMTLDMFVLGMLLFGYLFLKNSR
eukprot:TRINITY_DN7334_c0_g1_i1.p1 TRINITY_DN7334_c0_g1~~TRINITY_DN7334_c0_g1_i1.p1  ORF type:complete len:142 (+),score=23.49 TRINITY_DN7334_c0_g1_i1:106-531(+)